MSEVRLEHELQQCDAWDGIEKTARKHGLDWSHYIHEIKWDGFRLCAYVRDDRVDFFTRHGKCQNGKLPKIEQDLLDVFPAGTVLDGEIVPELWHEGGHFVRDSDGIVDTRFEYVQSVMLSLPERAVQVQEEQGSLVFVVFDSPAIEWNSTRGRWIRLFEHLRVPGVIKVEEGWRNGNIFMTDLALASEERHTLLCDMGFEGSVLKHATSMYNERLKGKGWYKWKGTWDADAVILGFTEGEGKFSHTIGSIIFGQPLKDAQVSYEEHSVEVANIDGRFYLVRGSCSGLDDATRESIWDMRDGRDTRQELIGTVITFSHMGLMHGGVRFRHPQFRRFRPDKPASQVTWHER